MNAINTRDLFLNMGKVVYLWEHSNLHKNWPIYLVGQYARSALELKQFLILESSDGMPLAYISWAFLSIESEARYLANPHSLVRSDWNSGARIWITDLVSPFNPKYTQEVIELLRKGIFRNTVARSLRVKNGSKIAKVACYWGLGVSCDQRRAVLSYYYQTAKSATQSEKILWERDIKPQ